MAKDPINKPMVDDDIVEAFKVVEGLPTKKQAASPYAAYQDLAKNWTIGYGHKIRKGEEHLKDKVMTPEETEALLRKDILEHQKPWINKVEVALTKNQLAALSSFAYHAGPGAMKAIVPRINAGDWEGVAEEMRFRGSKSRIDGKLQTVGAFSERREWEISRLSLGDDISDLASSYRGRKGLLNRALDWFRGPTEKTLARPEFDIDLVMNRNKDVLKELQAMTAGMAVPFDIDEVAWTHRLRVEGSGGAYHG